MAQVDRPLTDAQKLALIALGEAYDRWGPDTWSKPWGVREPTLDVLRSRGLAKLNVGYSTTTATITDEGRAMLATMGH